MSRQKKCPRGCGSFLLKTMVRLNNLSKKRSIESIRLLYCPKDDYLFNINYQELINLAELYGATQNITNQSLPTKFNYKN